MWTLGYADGADFNMQDSFNGPKLLPKPMAGTNSFGSPSLSPQCFRTINGPDHLLSFNHHIGGTTVHEQQQQQVVVSSRWNPTPEQLQTLEELYRSGTRTPSADQIQYITAQLRRYGKIEGKNVFYWFQNHKARERHKRRRHQLESVSSDEHQQQHQHPHQFGCILNSERRELEVNRRAVTEVEETKGSIPSTNSSTLAEKSISKARAEYRADGWIQLHEQGEILELDKNDTWQMMQFLSCGQETNIVRAIMCPKILNDDVRVLVSSHNRDEVTTRVVEGESKTLQLFPLQSGSRREDVDVDESMSEKPTEMLDSRMVRGNFSSNAPCQFFEFLPLKN